MKSVVTVLALALLCAQPVAANVAFDKVSESHTGTTGSTNEASFTWTHTPVGTPRAVLVFVFNANSNAVDVTSVTYGGVTMTAVANATARDTAGEPGSTKAFFLGASIPTGAQSIVVNRNNNANIMYANAFTLTAAADTAIQGTPVLTQEDQAPAEQSVDSGAVFACRFAGLYYGGSTVPAAGANSTLGGVNDAIDLGVFTCQSAHETTCGSGARNVGFSGASDDNAGVHLAIGESAAVATPQRTLLGVGTVGKAEQ